MVQQPIGYVDIVANIITAHQLQNSVQLFYHHLANPLRALGELSKQIFGKSWDSKKGKKSNVYFAFKAILSILFFHGKVTLFG